MVTNSKTNRKLMHHFNSFPSNDNSQPINGLGVLIASLITQGNLSSNPSENQWSALSKLPEETPEISSKSKLLFRKVDDIDTPYDDDYEEYDDDGDYNYD